MVANTDDVAVRMSLLDDISGHVARMDAEVKLLRRDLESLGGPAVTGAMGRTTASTAALDHELSKAHRSTMALSTGMVGWATTGVRDLGIGLGVLTAGVGAFGLVSAAKFAQSRAAFGALLDDVQEGNQLFRQLQQYNLQTPFQMPQLTAATQTLLQFGWTGDTVLRTIKSIGDVAALTGPMASENLGRISLALGQIRGSTTIRAQDLNQLVQSGFPAYKLLSEVYGGATADLRKQMESGVALPAEPFLNAVDEMSGSLERFQGGAIKQGHTLAGEWSNVMDTLRYRADKAFRPLAKELQHDLPGYTRELGRSMDEMAPSISSFTGDFIHLVAVALPPLAHGVAVLVDGIDRLAMAAAGGDLGNLGDELEAGFGHFIDSAAPVMPDLVDATIALVGVLPDMVDVLADLVPLVTPILELVDGLLSFGPTRQVVADLLLALLAYRAVTSVVGPLIALQKALFGVAAAEVAVSDASLGASVLGGSAGGAAGRSARGARIGGALRSAGKVFWPAAAIYGGWQIGSWLGEHTKGMDGAPNVNTAYAPITPGSTLHQEDRSTHHYNIHLHGVHDQDMPSLIVKTIDEHRRDRRERDADAQGAR